MISIKSPKELELMRVSGGILSEILYESASLVKEGSTTMDIEVGIRKMVKKHNVKAPFLGYRGYPAMSCISVNEEVVHGIPSAKMLRHGDIVSIDMGVSYKGYITDAARTYIVGEAEKRVAELVKTAKDAFYKAVEYAVDGRKLYDISSALTLLVESRGFSVVREFVSHGVGRQLHEEPFFTNFGKPHTGPLLKEGMTLAIEPMINMGVYDVKILSDGWTAVTADGQYSAHYENTVIVHKGECEIITDITKE